MAYNIAPSPTSHRKAVFCPQPGAGRSGVALCLSGGGFRASLFHLGAIRRLNEVGILEKVTTVAGVSGGSLLAAFMAQNLSWRHLPKSVEEWESRVAVPFRTFVATNLGTRPVLYGYLFWWSNAGINLLARRCQERLTDKTLQQLPDRPLYVFGATDLISGRTRVFDRDSREAWTVAKAVAISSCLPLFFPAYSQKAPERLSLADGGVDDDHAVEPVWRTHEILLVSDGGKVLESGWGDTLLWTLNRSAMVVWNQLREIRKRWLIENFTTGALTGAYWAIASDMTHFGSGAASPVPGYSEELARDVLGKVRTGYDAFSDAEIAALENHGYFAAEAATVKHLQALRCPNPPPLKVPHPAWMNERRVKDALRDSDRTLPPRY